MAFEEAFLQLLVQDYGLIALFLISIAANATIFLPMPLDLVVLWFGSVINIEQLGLHYAIAAGIVAGIGASIGEMTAYILGLLGISATEKAMKKNLGKITEIREKLQNKGMIVIFLGSLTPFPFDIIGIAAGLIKYDPKKFFVAALGGKLIRYLIVILAGYYGFEIVRAYLFF